MDWKHEITRMREIVQNADPDLSRTVTVIVNT